MIKGKRKVAAFIVLSWVLCYNIVGVIEMFYILLVILVVLDQFTKYLINKNLIVGQSIPVINNIFHLTYVRNTGAGFGILAGHRNLFILLTIIIVLALFVYRWKNNHNIFLELSLAFIIAGALGNLIDRIRLAYVVDYLDFRIWPVFNLADALVNVGIVVLIIYVWRSEGERR